MGFFSYFSRGKSSTRLSVATSTEVQKFQHRGQRGSLVLSKEDLDILELNGKISAARKKTVEQRQVHQEQIDVLQGVKANLKEVFNKRLEELDAWDYVQLIQDGFSRDGLELAEPGDGEQEAEVLRAMHRAEIIEKSKAMAQEQANAELMELYNMEPGLKEEKGQVEAKCVNQLMLVDTIKQKEERLLKKQLKIQKKIMEILEKSAKDKLDMTYKMLRGEIPAPPPEEGDDEDIDDSEQDEEDMTADTEESEGSSSHDGKSETLEKRMASRNGTTRPRVATRRPIGTTRVTGGTKSPTASRRTVGSNAAAGALSPRAPAASRRTTGSSLTPTGQRRPLGTRVGARTTGTTRTTTTTTAASRAGATSASATRTTTGRGTGASRPTSTASRVTGATAARARARAGATAVGRRNLTSSPKPGNAEK